MSSSPEKEDLRKYIAVIFFTITLIPYREVLGRLELRTLNNILN